MEVTKLAGKYISPNPRDTEVALEIWNGEMGEMPREQEQCHVASHVLSCEPMRMCSPSTSGAMGNALGYLPIIIN